MKPLFRAIVLALAATAVLSSPLRSLAQDENKQDLEKLKGDWQMVSLIYDGQNYVETHKPEHRSLTFWLTSSPNGGDSTFFANIETGEKNRFQIDATKQPKQLDFFLPKSFVFPDGRINTIYRLDSDTLEICKSPSSTKRPKEFEEKEAVIFVYKRNNGRER